MSIPLSVFLIKMQGSFMKNLLAGIRFDCNIYTKRHNYLYSSTGRDGGESNSIVKSKSIFRKICKTA